MQLKLALSGFGNVGRNFIKLVEEKQAEIARRYNLELRVVTVAGRQGSVHNAQGLDLQSLVALSCGRELEKLPGFIKGSTGPEAVAASNASVWVEATPSHARDPEPALSNFKGAFAAGMHVVSLSKGPLVCAFSEVASLAAKAGVKIKYSGATAAALPTIDVALTSLAGSRITSVEGILNGTSNFVLALMEKDGISFAEALQEARRRGIAEPDPALDVGGWDTACKLLIIANTLFGQVFQMADITVEGITGVTAADLKEARFSGGTIKLIGSAKSREGGYVLHTGPQYLPWEHPLAGVQGTTKGIYFCTDTMGPLAVIGGFSSPRGAAAAALKDIISIYP